MARKSRVWTGVLFGLLLIVPSFVSAGAARIVVVRSSALSVYDDGVRGFQDAMAGSNASMSMETLPEDSSVAQALLDRIDGEKPSLVVAFGAKAARLARARFKSVPVLFCMVIDPGEDLSYGGISMELSLADYVDGIRRSLPGVKKVGLIFNPARSSSLTQEAKALESKGLMVTVTATSASEVDGALDNVKRRAECLLFMPDPALFPPQAFGAFLNQAIQKGVPVVGLSPSFVKAGAVAAFFADFRNNGELAAQAASKVLGGESVRNIPVQLPTKVGASFNLAVARHLNLAVDGDAVKNAIDVVR